MEENKIKDYPKKFLLAYEEFVIKWNIDFNFYLKRCDLTEQNTNAIVNAANSQLWLGGGVAGAIRRKGGDIIQKECDKIASACEVTDGDVKYTGIGNFQNENLKYIFHAVGPYYKNGHIGEKESLIKTFKNCFLLADELKLESISLPPISSGIFGYPKDKCARIFYECLMEYVDEKIKFLGNKTLKTVYMTIIDYETYAVFIETHMKFVNFLKETCYEEINYIYPNMSPINNEIFQKE